MHVADLLARRLTVGQEEIDPLAIEPALVERDSYFLGGTEHVATSILGKVR